MKIIIYTVILVSLSVTVVGQKNNIKEKALEEIACIIASPFELLGKTDTAIIAAGRPSAIKGGNKWKIVHMDTVNSLYPDSPRIMLIATGLGALTLVLKGSDQVVKVIWYVPHKDALITEADFLEMFKNKFNLKSGRSLLFEKEANSYAAEIGYGGVVVMDLAPEKYKRRPLILDLDKLRQ